MSYGDVVFKRDESRLHNASSKVIYSNALCILILMVCAVYFLSAVLTKSLFCVASIIFAVLTIFSSIWGIFSDMYFNFYNNCTFTFKGRGTCIYEYDLDKDVLGSNSHVKVVIKSVKKIKFRHNKCIIYGEVLTKKPRRKDMVSNKCSCVINFGVDKNDLVSALNNLMEV